MSGPTIIGKHLDWVYKTDGFADAWGPTSSHENLLFISGNNPRGRDGKYRSGGPFVSKKSGVDITHSNELTVYRAGYYDVPAYRGKFYCQTPSTPPPPTLDDIEDFGPELYRAARPDKANFSLLNAAYELREVPRQLRQRMQDLGLHDISSYYLALQFGWKPLLRDIRDLHLKAFGLDKAVKQLLRDNGKPVRRTVRPKKYNTKSVTTLAEWDDLSSNLYPKLISQAVSDGRSKVELHSEHSMWFSGKFVYYLDDIKTGSYPDIHSPAMIRLRALLLGGNVSPKVVWNALPWTWLGDWFSNVGDSIANMGSDIEARLINEYAYIMRHVRTEARMKVTGYYCTGPDSITAANAEVRAWYDIKERAIASPFGFGIKDSDLTPQQIAIGAALGVTRGKRPGR